MENDFENDVARFSSYFDHTHRTHHHANANSLTHSRAQTDALTHSLTRERKPPSSCTIALKHCSKQIDEIAMALVDL